MSLLLLFALLLVGEWGRPPGEAGEPPDSGFCGLPVKWWLSPLLPAAAAA